MTRNASREILTSFKDALGNLREAPAETVAAIESAMGTPPPNVETAVMVARQGEQRELSGRAEIELEDGMVLGADDRLAADLPLGYHTLRFTGTDQVTRLIVTPGICHLPKKLRVWGWSAQLYATRSYRSWGMGDLAGLRELGRWSARELGAKILLVNPLQATLPIVPQERSPYFPSSRQFLNPLYLCIEEIPGRRRRTLTWNALRRPPRSSTKRGRSTAMPFSNLRKMPLLLFRQGMLRQHPLPTRGIQFEGQ